MTDDMMRKPKNFNEAQLMVINTHNVPCVVSAIPGSGKTGVITEKTARLLRDGKTVSAVTFTRSAAAELNDRVYKAVGRGFDSLFTCGTFHRLILNALQRSPDKVLVGLRIADDAEVRRVADAELKHADLKASKSNRKHLEAALARLSDPFGIDDATRRVANGHPLGEDMLAKARTLQSVADRVDRRLRDVGLVQMSSITRMGLHHVQSGRAVFPGQYVLVDEAQDVDEVQLALILGHLNLGAIVDAVGDDDQAIYGFREGLGFRGLERFRLAARAEPIQLGINYRSHKEILDLAGEVIVQNTERLPKILNSREGPGGTTGLVYWEDNESEARGIVAWIAQILAVSKPDETIGVIARQNWLLDGMGVALADSIPFVRDGGDSFWDEPLVGSVVSFLRCVADPARERAGLEQLLLAWGAESAGIDILRTESTGRSIGELVQRWRPEASAASTNTRRAMSWLVRLCKDTGYPVRPASDLDVEDALDAAHVALVETFEEYGRLTGKKSEAVESEVRRIKAAFRTLGRVAGPLGRRISRVTMAAAPQDKCALRLMTMHGSKGLEFDHVFVIGCEEETIPGRHADDDSMDEERRLMYVAMTRAKKNLVLSYPRRVRLGSVDRGASKSSILSSLPSLKDTDGAKLNVPWPSRKWRSS